MTTSISDNGVQFADGSVMESASKLGLRNKIINGGFAINQRAYVSGAATTAGQYTVDRWKVTGTAGITFSTTANKTAITVPSGQALQQVIEGLNLQTGTYVLSWEGTAQGKIGGGSYGASGITGSITGGTNTTIEFGPGTVANVQLEVGSVATPFEHRPYGMELGLCQRYYETGGFVTCTAINTGGIFPQIFYKAAKRASPTLSNPRSVVLTNLVGADGSIQGCYQNSNDSTANATNWTASAEL